MSLWVPHSAFWDWQVCFGPPSLKYYHTLHAIFGVSKLVIIIDNCVVRSWFTFAYLQSMSLKLPYSMYFIFYCVFEWPVLAYIFTHWTNIACLPAYIKNTHRDTYWKLKMLSQTVRIAVQYIYVKHSLLVYILLYTYEDYKNKL